MPNYSKAIIYKLCCKDPEITDIYVGSTCSKYKRKNHHKDSCINQKIRDYNYPVYQFIREHGNWDNWEFVPIEVYPCESKTELFIRERYWFEKLGATLNSHYPQRTKKEYSKKYRLENKEKEKARGAKYRLENKEKEQIRHNKYRSENKEKEKARGAKYRANNSEKIKRKVICECGSKVNRRVLSRHLKTIKHQTWKQQPEPNIIFVD